MTELLLVAALCYPLVVNPIQWLLGIDQWINTYWRIEGDVNDGWGYADEAISARAFRCHIQDLIDDRPMTLINWVFFWQVVEVTDSDGNVIRYERDHCHRAWRAEIERRQLPDHYRLEKP